VISVEDLIKWTNDNAVGRSTSFPKGWIRHEDLRTLSIQVRENYPLDFVYSMQKNTKEKDE